MFNIILFSAALGYVFGEVSKIPNNLRLLNKFKPLNRKPFTCGMCLSFWTALIISNWNGLNIQSLGIAFTAALTAVIIKSIDEKLNR